MEPGVADHTASSYRNQKIFQDRHFSAQETTLKALCDAREWQEAQIQLQPNIRARPMEDKNPNLAFTCRSDAAWKSDSRVAGGAWSFYNKQGGLMTSYSQTFSSVISPLVEEGLALRQAMEHAVSLGFGSMIFETDSKQLVAAITENQGVSDLHGILLDITLLSGLFTSSLFRFCHRDTLFLEDGLAKQALRAHVT